MVNYREILRLNSLKYTQTDISIVSASKHDVVQNSRTPAIMPTSLFEALFSIPS